MIFSSWTLKSGPEVQKQGLESQQLLYRLWPNLLTTELIWSRLTTIYINLVKTCCRVIVVWCKGQMLFVAPFGADFVGRFYKFWKSENQAQMGPISELGLILVWSLNFGNMFRSLFRDQTSASTKLILQRRNCVENFPPFYSKFDRYLSIHSRNTLIPFSGIKLWLVQN